MASLQKQLDAAHISLAKAQRRLIEAIERRARARNPRSLARNLTLIEKRQGDVKKKGQAVDALKSAIENQGDK